nr:winged helix DNA-binding domain-containing protein [Propionicimonas sp.]
MTTGAEQLSSDAVIAFRLGAHHLAERLPGSGLLEAAGRCAVQDSPRGSALLALHARVRGVTADGLESALADRSLLQTWSLRGAPFCFPTADAPVYTTGVLPPTEEAGRHLLPGVAPALDRLELSLGEAVELTGAELEGVLSGHRLAIGPLGAELAARIADRLPKEQRATWQQEGPYAKGQPLGEGVVHFCLRILALRGMVCFAPRAGNKAPFVLVGEWLGGPVPEVDPDVTRAEVLRRYLRCYGPSTRGQFAAWLGVRTGDTGPWWSLVEDELTRVDFRGTSWILTADLAALRSSELPQGVRLLPPRDPYTQLRDRDTIVAAPHHRDVWKPVGEPGTVLVDGRIVGTWRPRKSGRRLDLAVTAFGPLSDRDQDRLADEAAQLGPLRGAASVEVRFDGS